VKLGQGLADGLDKGERLVSEELTGKVALVTGAGKGMGQATAQMLASHGAFVAVADIDGAAGMAVVEVIRSSGGHAEFIEVDVACSQQVSAMIASTVRVFGRLDVAVNNAAIMPDDSPTSDIDEDLWDRIIGVNLRGTMLCLKYELQQMLKQGSGGSIVNLSSVLGFRPKTPTVTPTRDPQALVSDVHGILDRLRKVAELR